MQDNNQKGTTLSHISADISGMSYVGTAEIVTAQLKLFSWSETTNDKHKYEEDEKNVK